MADTRQQPDMAHRITRIAASELMASIDRYHVSMQRWNLAFRASHPPKQSFMNVHDLPEPSYVPKVDALCTGSFKLSGIRGSLQIPRCIRF